MKDFFRKTHPRLLWILLALLLLGVLHFRYWQAYEDFLTNPNLFAGDARQQIVPYLVPNPGTDYIARYYREVFMPVGVDALYSLAERWSDPASFAKYTGLVLLFLTIGFTGAGVRHLAGPWAALASMVFILSASIVGDNTLNGLPRGFSAPLMALAFWAASSGRWRSMAAITVLAMLFYPTIGVISGLWLGLITVFHRNGQWHKWPSVNFHQITLLSITIILACACFIVPGRWNNPDFGTLITHEKLEDYPEAGERGRYRSKQDNTWQQSLLGTLQSRSYLSIAGNGKALIPATNLRQFLLMDQMLPFTLGLFVVMATGLCLLHRSGRRHALWLALNAAIAITIAYTVAFFIKPYAFLPDRYIAYSFSVLIPAFFACSLEGYALYFSEKKLGMLVALRILIFALPVLLLGGSGVGNSGMLAGDLKRKHISPEMDHAFNQLPGNAVLGGWPHDTLDSIAYFTRRHVWLHFETHQAFHTGYTMEMRRRMMLMIDGLFSPDPESLTRLQQEGVTHLLLYMPLYQRVKPPYYFDPFNHYLSLRWDEWRRQTPAVLKLPARSILFDSEEWRIVSLVPPQPIVGMPPLGSKSKPGTIAIDSGAFIHRIPKDDRITDSYALDGIPGLFDNAAIVLDSTEEATAQINVEEGGNYQLFVYSHGSQGKGFRLAIGDKTTTERFGNAPLSLKNGGSFHLEAGALDIRATDIHPGSLLSAVVLTRNKGFSKADLMSLQFPEEVKLLKSYQIPPAGTVRFGDVNGDGKMDIIALTLDWSVNVFDHDGRKLWSYQAPSTNGPCVRMEFEPPASVWDFDQDGRAELVHWRVIEGKDMLVIADGATGKVLQQTKWPTPVWPHLYNNFRTVIAKLHSGYPDNIVTFTDSGGLINVSAYTSNLELLWSYEKKFDKDYLGHYVYPVDVNNDTVDELAISHVMLDANGKEVWSNLEQFTNNHLHSDGYRFLDLDKDGDLEAISAQSNLGLYVFDAATGKVLWKRPAAHAQQVEFGNVFGGNVPGPQIGISARTYESEGGVHSLFAQAYWFDSSGKLLSTWPQSPLNGNPFFAKGDWYGSGKENIFWHRFHVNSDGTGTLFFPEPVYQAFDFMGNGSDQVITLDPLSGTLKVFGWKDAIKGEAKRNVEYMRARVTNHSNY